MDFQTSIKTCLTEKYARFQGRASRSEYWWFFLAVVIGGIVTSLIWAPLNLVFTLAVIVPLLAAGARRLQDTGRPGWYIVIPAALSLLMSLFTPAMPDPDAMMMGSDPAAQIEHMDGMMGNMGGMAFFAVLGLIQLVVSLVFLWWLTRPSDPAPNAYGPPPVA
ncbi:DUF805 domain-containing protein [Sulfitobacter sp. PS-8MA]|uniref:DUF805 domain-containing protein n=1 Tax=Sulfitobacter sp. PS-8MA TaxID=3237707 RepID=UPI0034C64F49